MHIQIDSVIQELEYLAMKNKSNRQGMALYDAMAIAYKYKKIEEILENRIDDENPGPVKLLGSIEEVIYGDNRLE